MNTRVTLTRCALLWHLSVISGFSCRSSFSSFFFWLSFVASSLLIKAIFEVGHYSYGFPHRCRMKDAIALPENKEHQRQKVQARIDNRNASMCSKVQTKYGNMDPSILPWRILPTLEHQWISNRQFLFNLCISRSFIVVTPNLIMIVTHVRRFYF